MTRRELNPGCAALLRVLDLAPRPASYPPASPAARDDAAALDAHLAAQRARVASRAAQVSDAAMASAWAGYEARTQLAALGRRCQDTVPARAMKRAVG